MSQMIENKSLTFISSGLLKPKKEYNKLTLLNFYLNYGLLGLASDCHLNSLNRSVLHGEYLSPNEFIESKLSFVDTKYPLFLSIPSFYAVPWAQQLILLIRRRLQGQRIVVGGRWVANNNVPWLQEKLGQVDFIVEGLADGRIPELLYPKQFVNSATPFTSHDCLSSLDYKLLDGYEDIPPSIEVSRGCGSGCEFCGEGDLPLVKLKEPCVIFEEVRRYIQVTGNNRPKFYFEASNFSPSVVWVTDFITNYKNTGFLFTWRAEVRADTFSEVNVCHLADAGLKIVDIGLESCSHTQLVQMRKTNNPERYLHKADTLLRKCYDSGVWAKINLLLYPGESEDTVTQTVEWLLKRAHMIKGVSVGPLSVFGCNEKTLSYIQKLEQLGAVPVNRASYIETGITDLHLSNKMNYYQAIETSIKISKTFMTAKDYFDIKTHGYYRNSVSFSQFMEIVTSGDVTNLPFSILGNS